MGKVIARRHAVRYLNRLPKEAKDRIKEILKELEDDPYRAIQCKAHGR